MPMWTRSHAQIFLICRYLDPMCKKMQTHHVMRRLNYQTSSCYIPHCTHLSWHAMDQSSTPRIQHVTITIIAMIRTTLNMI